MSHKIRLAQTFDSEAILNIYAPYVRETAISFEVDVPGIDEFAKRIETISQTYPYLVYLVDETIVGYAYASKYKERAAYGYDVEVSVYIQLQYHGAGIANKLYERLFILLNKLGYYNAYAGYTEPNVKSMKFHHKFGFTSAGIYHNTGYKFNHWHDVTWLEKAINDFNETPKELKKIGELTKEYLDEVLAMD